MNEEKIYLGSVKTAQTGHGFYLIGLVDVYIGKETQKIYLFGWAKNRSFLRE